jgi:hypothetical protein
MLMVIEPYYRGELIRNPGFDEWQRGKPVFWDGHNFAPADRADTGKWMLRLGRDPERVAEIYQGLTVSPGSFLELRFRGRVAVAGSKMWVAITWLNRDRETIGSGMELAVLLSEDTCCRHYVTVSGACPRTVVQARVSFQISSRGQFDLDYVSVVAR